MRLIAVSISGFRRFADETTVRLVEPLIAVVGSNEAGKSSFLRALTTLNDNAPVESRDRTRRTDIPIRITATFELQDADRAGLDGIPGADRIHSCTIIKADDGHVRMKLDEPPPHSLNPRKQVAERWPEVAQNLRPSGDKNQRRVQQRLLASVKDFLESERVYLGSAGVEALEQVAVWLREVIDSMNPEDDDTQNLSRDAERLEDLADHERVPAPMRAKLSLLEGRPKFLLFSQAARDLRETYDLSDHAQDPPDALANLASLAELDLEELHRAASEEDMPHVSELIEAANRTLFATFSSAWIRSDVVPVLQCNGTILHLLVRAPDGSGLSWIGDRSDGLRWFIALLAFLNSEAGPRAPILLVDEAERHLSYDAQASLIDVLETQAVVPSVVYTTHSAGCLPSDLGTGIRPVLPLYGERSTISNCFWTLGAGFSPLLFAMGLGPLAFTASRNQIVCEGPSECLLLPTLLREATGEAKLGYQVAPGASTVAAEHLPDLLAEGGRVAFLLDGDRAGESRKEYLRSEGGVDPSRIVTYADLGGGQGLVFEDLIDPSVYAEAFNLELLRWQNSTEKLSAEDLHEVGRPKLVDEWCRQKGLNPVTKSTLCQTLTEMGANGRDLVATSHRGLLVELHHWAVEQLPPPRFVATSA